MTNGEFYETCMRRIEYDYGSAVAIINGKPNPCELKCEECLRAVKTEENKRCSDLRLVEWIRSEYIPQKPKLNERQKAFCKCFAVGWIVRQPNGVLLLFNWKPVKTERGYYTKRNGDPVRYINMSSIMFPEFLFIKNDDEPINISEMLTWEVEE